MANRGSGVERDVGGDNKVLMHYKFHNISLADIPSSLAAVQ